MTHHYAATVEWTAECFIANSLNLPVEHAPETIVAL